VHDDVGIPVALTERRAEQQRLLEPLEAARQVRFIGLLATVSYAGAPVPERTSDECLALGLGTTPGHLLRRAEQVHGTLWVSQVGDIATPAQYALLSALAWRPDTDQRAAGGMASLDKSSAADVVARLIRRGWITSTQDPTDRRRKRLELSPSALRLLARVTPAVRSVQDDLLRPLRSDDRAELVESTRLPLTNAHANGAAVSSSSQSQRCAVSTLAGD
jgi:DNA-binding MarR family transcriptional regulator